MKIEVFLGLVAGSWIFYQFLRARYPLLCFILYFGLFALIVLYYSAKVPLLLLIPRMTIEYMGVILVSGALLVPLLRISLGFSLGLSDATERTASFIADSYAWRGSKSLKVGGSIRRTLVDDLKRKNRGGR
ncbi:MAG: hypothetical protein KME45_26730 [Stenomitos rutilans HA7619-LM2]|jgi:hypothetical protein|nr:hypothetical protein [Stenomitos rutilans HA7619-LM2]